MRGKKSGRIENVRRIKKYLYFPSYVFGWKNGKVEDIKICIFLCLAENKSERLENVICLNLPSYPYYIRTFFFF